MRIAILQSSYIPWYGYFKIISEVDLFVFFDIAQFTKNDWRNRNRILVNNQPVWLTIPVGESIHRKIFEVQLPTNSWRDKHIKSITYAYSKAPYFHLIERFVLPIIRNKSITTLSEINQSIIMTISTNIFGLKTDFHSLKEEAKYDNPSKRIAKLVEFLGGTTYVSGPSGSNYLDASDFIEANIVLKYTNYGGFEQKNNDTYVNDVMLSIVHGIAWHGQNALRVIGELE
jgi:hypothetical protein